MEAQFYSLDMGNQIEDGDEKEDGCKAEEEELKSQDTFDTQDLNRERRLPSLESQKVEQLPPKKDHPKR